MTDMLGGESASGWSEQPMEPVDLRTDDAMDPAIAEMHRHTEAAERAQTQADAITKVLELVDARIDEKIAQYHDGYVGPTFEQVGGILAELQAGERTEAYRNFIIAEAKSLGVRPGEVAGGARRAD